MGDGGPRLDSGTNACACGDGCVELDADVEDEGGPNVDDAETEADDKDKLENRVRIASGDSGGVGGILELIPLVEVGCTSRE